MSNSELALGLWNTEYPILGLVTPPFGDCHERVIAKTSSACPISLVDHIKALKRGGADDPGNIQWQAVEDAKAKDRHVTVTFIR
jgi:hypothetical protein